MNTAPRRWSGPVLGFLLLAVLVACTVTGDGGYVGVAYEPPGYEYGGWGPRYYVAPPRGGEHRDEHAGERGGEHRAEPPRPAPPRSYRPVAPSRPAPSIPTRPHGH